MKVFCYSVKDYQAILGDISRFFVRLERENLSEDCEMIKDSLGKR